MSVESDVEEVDEERSGLDIVVYITLPLPLSSINKSYYHIRVHFLFWSSINIHCVPCPSVNCPSELNTLPCVRSQVKKLISVVRRTSPLTTRVITTTKTMTQSSSYIIPASRQPRNTLLRLYHTSALFSSHHPSPHLPHFTLRPIRRYVTTKALHNIIPHYST